MIHSPVHSFHNFEKESHIEKAMHFFFFSFFFFGLINTSVLILKAQWRNFFCLNKKVKRERKQTNFQSKNILPKTEIKKSSKIPIWKNTVKG